MHLSKSGQFGLIQVNIRILGQSNLYWESYSSGETIRTRTGPLSGIVSFCMTVLPMAVVTYPTLAIYIWIIKVRFEKMILNIDIVFLECLE